MTKTLVLFFVLGLAACADDVADDVDSTIAACDCPTPAAVDVGYDNGASGLPGENVQDALDDVTARTDPAGDAFARVSLVESTTSSIAADFWAGVAQCPEGYKALGGSCKGRTTDGALGESNLGDRWYSCTWTNPTLEVGVELTAQVSCLAPPAE